MKNKQLPFWLFTCSVFSALLLPKLLQDGMFLDGLLNSAIARNLAKGEGEFWVLQYSKTLGNPFYDQLPLAYGLQSLFFKLFGDHLFVERVYCFLCALITGILISRIWKHIFRHDNELAALGWLPFLLWIITPVVFWSYSNNMLENTMTIFDLAAIYQIIKAFDTNNKTVLRLLLAGALILAAFLSKGPVGLFPLAAVFIYWLIFKNISFSKAMAYSVIVFGISIFLLSLLFLFEQNAFHTINEYIGFQVIDSVEGKRELAPSRYFIIKRLPNELIPVMILVFLIFAFSQIKRMKITVTLYDRKLLLFFFALALSGSLPIIISLKQSGYYLVPSFPFYAIVAGIIAAPRLNAMIQKIKPENRGFRTIKFVTIILFCGTLIFSFMQTGKIGRDKEIIKDIYCIGKRIPENSIISICPNMFQDWVLHAYLMRYFSISMDDKNQYEFYITDKNCKSEMNNDYMKLDLNTTIYEIYKRK